jgi:hypothetical protein
MGRNEGRGKGGREKKGREEGRKEGGRLALKLKEDNYDYGVGSDCRKN